MLMAMAFVPLVASDGGAAAVRGVDGAGDDVAIGGRSEPGGPGVVHQHVHGSELTDEVADLGGVAQVGGDEAGLTPLGPDGLDDLGAPLGIPTVQDDRETVAAEPQRRGPADA